MTAVVPLFPLSHVLLPGMPLPLHIFEQRYHEMIRDLTVDRAVAVAIPGQAASSATFAVVALRSGTEARSRTDDEAAAPDVETVGTMAEILEIEAKPDGTVDLLAVGSRRFRLHEVITTGKSYFRAEVEFLDEPDGQLDERQAVRARELLAVYDSYLARLAGRATGSELPDDPLTLSYHLAARLPLQPNERQQLLQDTTTAARLEHVARLLRREIALLQCTRSIAVSPSVLRIGVGVN